MAEAFGSKDQCIHCHGSEMAKAQAIVVQEGKKSYETYVCSDACAQATRAFFELVTRRRTAFLALVIGWIALVGAGVVGGIVAGVPRLLAIPSLATALMGLAVTFFMPFATPDRRSRWWESAKASSWPG
jgi:hypothetical protein